MAELSVPAVVPSGGEASGVGSVPSRSTSTRPMSLAGLAPEARAASMVAAIASVDGRGRIAERSVVRALGWQAGQRLQFRPLQQAVLVRPDSQGLFTVTGQGYVRLPAPVRHWCLFSAGERVLVAARPEHGVLLVHTLAAVETLLAEHHITLGVVADER